MFTLPEAFESFNDARKQGFIEVKNLKEQGRKVVGTYCVFTPWELIMAAGAIPVSLCGMSEEPIAEAERHLPRNLCPLIKSSYGFAVSDTCPYFYFSDMLVGETTCDGKKKMYEYLGELKPMHIMQLPPTNKGEMAFAYWRNEMLLFKQRLEQEFGVEITEEKLREAIRNRNDERRLLKEFYGLGAMEPPTMTGLQLLQVLYGSSFKLDRAVQKQELAALTARLRKEYEEGARPVSDKAPRILVTGCPIGGATEKIVRIIEESGGVVVCFESCSGAKGNDELVDETIDPIDALTAKYLNTACSCMSPNDNRLVLLSKLMEQYRVAGVIDVVLQACHTYNVETHRVKKFVNGEKGIPYMSLETDYSQSDMGQLKTRISAFIEML